MKKAFFLLAALISMAAVSMAADIKEGVTTAINGVENIKCLSNVTLHISKGPRATVRVVENAKQHSTVSFAGNTLNVAVPDDGHGNRDISRSNVKTELFVTLPQMIDVSNSGILELDAKDMTASADVKIKNHGQAKIDLGTFTSRSGALSFTNNGAATFSGSLIDVAEFNITNNGVAKTGKNMTVRAKRAYMSNPGVFTVSGVDISADECKLSCSGVASGSGLAINCGQTTLSVSGSYSAETTVKGRKLDVSVSGVMNGKMSFDGGDMSVRCSGQTNSALKVKCDDLSLSATGDITSAVTGKAHSVTLSGNVKEDCIKGLSAENVENRSRNNKNIIRYGTNNSEVW